MKKRLLANLADDEESDQFETERVTRSETPEVANKPKNNDVSRRALTPDIPMKAMCTPVLPPLELLKERPAVKKYKSEEELEAYVQKQMREMENSVKNDKDKFNGLEPEVQELLDSYKHIQQQQQQQPKSEERNIPIRVEERDEPEPRPPNPPTPSTPPRPVLQTPLYSEPESTKPAVEETVSYRLDYNKNPIKEREERKSGNNGINRSEDRNSRNDIKPNNTNKITDNPWDSDLLRHVLDGGLQGK